jgi:lipopolysaccharide export system permease protein
MRLIESYIFTRMLRAFVLTLVVLSATVWLSQALREFDLVSAMGQTIVTFLQITLLLLPALATVVSPVAILIGVVFTFRTLNAGSELVVINAAGTPQTAILKPVLLVGLIGAILMASMTLYFAPLSLRVWRTLITDVRGNIITTILREGEFMSLSPGLTFHLRRRAPDGTMQGIFMSDSRDPEETVTYLAERGAVLDNPLGVFMVMNNGTIQKTSKKDKSNSIIEFTSYAYDLSSFAAQSAAPPFKPQERPTRYLIHPNPNDRFYQQFPGKFRAELHYRLTAPFNAILFAILPLVFLGQAETTRQQRSATIGMAVGSAVAFGAIQFVLTSAAEDHFLAVLGLYVVPLSTIALGMALVLAGKQVRPPESLIAFGDSFAHRMRTLFRGAAAAPARSA